MIAGIDSTKSTNNSTRIPSKSNQKTQPIFHSPDKPINQAPEKRNLSALSLVETFRKIIALWLYLAPL
jgi:hypothetical protein